MFCPPDRFDTACGMRYKNIRTFDAKYLESKAVLIDCRIDRTVSFIFIGIPVTELLDDDYPLFVRQAGE